MIESLIIIAFLIFPYPDKITVRVTGLKECEPGMRYEIVEVPFKDYVKGVMVNEFGTGWDDDALKAGAIAIKSYALYQYYTGGKYGGYDQGIVYDCDWDQVYNPDIRRADTDNAVDETWHYVLLSADGSPFSAHYLAWPNACDSFFGEGKCMSQRVSIKQAERGMSWVEILNYAYDDVAVGYGFDRIR